MLTMIYFKQNLVFIIMIYLNLNLKNNVNHNLLGKMSCLTFIVYFPIFYFYHKNNIHYN